MMLAVFWGVVFVESAEKAVFKVKDQRGTSNKKGNQVFVVRWFTVFFFDTN